MVINPIVGVYIPIMRIPIKGGMAIPNTTSLDPGSFGLVNFDQVQEYTKIKNYLQHIISLLPGEFR